MSKIHRWSDERLLLAAAKLARHRGLPKLVKLRWQDRECLRAVSSRCLYGRRALTSAPREILQRILTETLVWLRAECVKSRQ